MKILRKRGAPHIEVHIDGETRTILHICTKCKMITKYTGPDAFANAHGDSPAFVQAHLHQAPEMAAYDRLKAPISELLH